MNDRQDLDPGAASPEPVGTGERLRVAGIDLPIVMPASVIRIAEAARKAGRRPGSALALMIVIYVGVFGRLTWMQQSNYGTFGFDMGIFDQGIWLLSRFKDPFVTVRGLSLWGNHVNPNVLLFVPIYWFGGGPHALYLVQTIAMALGAVPLWLIAREKLAEPWSALVVPGAYLLFPSLEWINWWHFHPEALAITPMLFAWWFARHRRWLPYAICVALVIFCKEDAAFVVIVLGILVAAYFDRRVGVITVGAALTWLVIATRVIIPAATSGATPFYLDRFSAFGNSLGEIVYNVFRHPSRAIRLMTMSDRFTYYRMLFVPVAGLCFSSPVFLVALPPLVVNATSSFGYTHNIHYHYQSLIIAGIFLAVAETCGHFAAWPAMRRASMGLLAVTAVATNVAWSPSPLSVKYHATWALHKPDRAAFDDAVKRVPPNAGVSASYTIISHLTHRVHAYEWPNPFHTANWGIKDRHPDPQTNVDYLVLDTGLNADASSVLSGLLAPGGGFKTIYRNGPVMVARRVRA